MSGERLDLDAVAVDPVCAVRVPAAVALRRLVLPLSVVDGALEVMLKRRTRGDDWFGVDEPLTENDVYIQTMWISVGAMDSMAVVQKEMEEIINYIEKVVYDNLVTISNQ